MNVITVCWRYLAYRDYVTAAHGVPAIGRGIGRFLIFLNSVTGVRFDQMHLIGFSLGAHAVGNAGRETGSRVARVTGEIYVFLYVTGILHNLYFLLP